MTTTQRLARYETAQEIIGMMIALRSAWIAAEQAKAKPDEVLIARWVGEQDRLAAEEDELRMDDERAIDRILSEYGPIVRAALSD